jgi:hypothetical protein
MRCWRVDDRGTAALVYASLSPVLPPPLRLLDFDVTGITSALWASTAEKLRVLATRCRASNVAFLFPPEPLLPSARAAGVHTMAIPSEFDEGQEVALAVAGYVSGEIMVKMVSSIAEKSQHLPFRGAFDFRGGGLTDNPLRRAAVLAIALGLEDQRAVRRVA